MSYCDNSLLHWSQHGAGHRPGQDLPTCSSCLMVFSCWVWIFSCSRALDSSFQSLSFKPAMQFSAREGDPSSSCFWACSISTSCFSCKVSCSFPYRDKVGRDPKSRDHTPAPPGHLYNLREGAVHCSVHVISTAISTWISRPPAAPPVGHQGPLPGTAQAGWGGEFVGSNALAPRARPQSTNRRCLPHLKAVSLPRVGLRCWSREAKWPGMTLPG